MGHARDGAWHIAHEGQTNAGQTHAHARQTHAGQPLNSKKRADEIGAGKQKTRHVAGCGMCAGSM